MASLRRVVVFTAVVLTSYGCNDVLQAPDYERAHNQVPTTQALGDEKRDSLAPLLAFDHPNRLPGRYIVRFDARVPDSRALSETIVRERGGRVYKVLQSLKGFWGELPDQAIDHLRRHPNVRYIEADVAMRAESFDSIQYPAPQPIDRIDERNLPLDGRYEYAANGTGVHVWIIDSGVNRNASELAGRIDETWWTTIDGKDPYADCQGHGTLMAIAVAGTYAGVAKNATIHSARVDTDCNNGWSTGAASSAFEWIADYSPRPVVANLSASVDCVWIFCGFTADDAAEYAWDHGVTVVVAAGRKDDTTGADACGFSPAHVGKLITVGATDLNDSRHTYSNYGSCVDLFAPVLGGGGTSTAAAMVTGAVALYLQDNPSASPSTVASAIFGNATQNVLSNIGSGSPNKLLYTNPPVLAVTISGPTTVTTDGNKTWTSNAVNGEGSYSYAWYRMTDHWWPRGSSTCHYDTPWQLVGTGPSYTSYVSLNDYDFRIRVDVTSAGEEASSTRNVYVGDGQECPL